MDSFRFYNSQRKDLSSSSISAAENGVTVGLIVDREENNRTLIICADNGLRVSNHSRPMALSFSLGGDGHAYLANAFA